MMTNPSIDVWIQDYTSALLKVAQNSLGLTSLAFLGQPADEPLEEKLACVGTTLTTDQETLFLSLHGTEAVFKSLVMRFLHITPEEPELSKEDIHDGLKELINISVGVLKRQMQSSYSREIHLGLPLIVDGRVKKQKDQKELSTLIQLGEYKLMLKIVLAQRVAEPEKPVQEKTPIDALGEGACLSTLNWFGEILTATLILVQNCLNLDNYKVLGRLNDHPKENISGVYIPLISSGDAILIGILVESQNLKKITKNFLKLDYADEIYSPEAVSDATKEIINILAGVIKRQLVNKQPIVRSGLPIFIDGYLETSENQERYIVGIEIDHVEAYIVLLRQRSPVSDKYESVQM
jgi:CheY-specific phosphatase CheX